MAKHPLLDLHGRTTDEVEDLVDRFLHTNGQKGVKRARIMTGKGTGKVQKMVTAYLMRGGFPYEFERLENGQRNEGVLVVFLDD